MTLRQHKPFLLVRLRALRLATGWKSPTSSMANDDTPSSMSEAFSELGYPETRWTPLIVVLSLEKWMVIIHPCEIEDPAQVGDAIEIVIYEGDSDQVKARVREFGHDVAFRGLYPARRGTLVVLQEGYGHRRNNPSLRRLLGLAQHGISQADPAIWGAHTYLDPLDTTYDPFGRNGGDTRVLLMPTIGDVQVPTNTGVAMARDRHLWLLVKR